MASDHSTPPKDIWEFLFSKDYQRSYMVVFGTLLVFTVITVAISFVDLEHWFPGANMTVGLIIATFKATLVMLFFMHLVSEKQLIYLVLGFTFFFFVGLMGLTIWAMLDYPKLTTIFM